MEQYENTEKERFLYCSISVETENPHKRLLIPCFLIAWFDLTTNFLLIIHDLLRKSKPLSSNNFAACAVGLENTVPMDKGGAFRVEHFRFAHFFFLLIFLFIFFRDWRNSKGWVMF